MKKFLKIIRKNNFTDKEFDLIEKWIRKEFDDCDVETYLKVYVPKRKEVCEVPNIIIDKKGISMTIWYKEGKDEIVGDAEYKNLNKEDKHRIIMEILKNLEISVD